MTARRVLVAALALAAVLPSPAAAQRFTADDRESLLLSRTGGGGFPDGASRNGVVSYDRQLASYAAFESDATNIVAGDLNGVTDVFLVPRARPYSLAGEPWAPGVPRLVSVGVGGAPANGPSYLPDIGGDQLHPARCIAFLSAASNLVPGDTNGRLDAFVQDLRTGKTTRVALSRGSVSEVKVDGSCTRVAFVSDATGVRQVYVRLLDEKKPFMASVSNGGRPGNGSSSQISFSKLGGGKEGCSRSCRATVGEAVAFTSEATNLDRKDRNGVTDVYVRSFTRTRARGPVKGRTTLVTRTRAGAAGNGPSDQPDIGDNGAWVAYRTAASDLLTGDSNGVPDIARANAQEPGRNQWVSRSQAVGSPANGASAAPTITRSGSMTFFESDASNLQPTVRGSGFFDRNGSGDIFFAAALSGNVSLQSRDSANEILNNHESGTPHAAAKRPSASYYGNYVVWESGYPLVDLDLAGQVFPELSSTDAAARSNSEPGLNQVYLRYIGPA